MMNRFLIAASALISQAIFVHVDRHFDLIASHQPLESSLPVLGAFERKLALMASVR